MNKILKTVQANFLPIGFSLTCVLLLLYIFSSEFRTFLEERNLDPNFIISFTTLIALFLTLIQGVKDKRYSYNIRLDDSIEDKGAKIIGKLLVIRNKSQKLILTAQTCIAVKNSGAIFKDLNNSFSKEDVENGMELVVAYIDLYFPEMNTRWNTLLEKLSGIANIVNPILLTYQENLPLILEHRENFRNIILDNAPASLKVAKVMDAEIDDITKKMRDEIVEKMNGMKKKIKDSI